MKKNNIFRATWLIDESWLKDNSFVDFNLHSKHIAISMQFIQDELISNVLGDCLAEYLQKLIQTNKIHLKTYDAYNKIVTDYIAFLFVYGIPLHCNVPLTFSTSNSGLKQNSSETFNTLQSFSEIRQVNAWYKTNYDLYIERLINYLKSIREKLVKDLPNCNIPCLHVPQYVHTLIPNYYPKTQYQLWKK